MAEEVPADTVPRAVGRLRVALEDAYSRASRDLGLTPPQAELLCAAMRPTAVGDLAQTLRCDRSNVSRLVDRASMRGLIERRAGDQDARVSLIRLTPKGDRLARRFITSLEAQLAPILDRWSGQSQQAAIKVLNELSDALDAARDQPSHPARVGQ
jgi:DNA-binding MarR family transcriptional regulator